uniref:Uncharacterized protein n=1 Tax=Glossina pallidipes TaxID=7398 RepID=A0A1A9ZWS2_GLOPL
MNDATMNKPFGRGFISTAGASPEAPPVMPPPTRSPPLLLVKRTGGAGGLSSSLDMVSSGLFSDLMKRTWNTYESMNNDTNKDKNIYTGV